MEFKMLKKIFIALFIVLSIIGCRNENVNEPFNYERDTPVLLKEKIDSISSNREYYGTNVYRYEWKQNYIYHIMIPISSCAYCELYDSRGKKIKLNENEFSSFLQTKSNKIIVWEWGK